MKRFSFLCRSSFKAEWKQTWISVHTRERWGPSAGMQTSSLWLTKGQKAPESSQVLSIKNKITQNRQFWWTKHSGYTFWYRRKTTRHCFYVMHRTKCHQETFEACHVGSICRKWTISLCDTCKMPKNETNTERCAGVIQIAITSQTDGGCDVDEGQSEYNRGRDVQTLRLWLSWQPSLCRPRLMLPFRGRGEIK